MNYLENVDILNEASMNEHYESYLNQHIENVMIAYKWLLLNLPELFNDELKTQCLTRIAKHDISKRSLDEYKPYAEYFYGKQTPEVKQKFDYAWNHHQKSNPHHWQYWILLEDEGKEKCLDIPLEYIIEMICDHWSFSWSSGDLSEIFT